MQRFLINPGCDFVVVGICRDLDPNRTAESLGLEAVPSRALFDEDGALAWSFEGWVPPQTQVEQLDEMLGNLEESTVGHSG